MTKKMPPRGDAVSWPPSAVALACDRPHGNAA